MSQKNKIKIINNNPFEGREGLVYVRVSSKRQEIEGTGLQSQEGRCITDLNLVKVPYVKTFPDSFTGGGDFMKRPAMKELLAYIDAHPHKKYVVAFDDLKRFARDVEFHLKLRSAFKIRDVLLRCLNYNFDESPEGRFSELIMAGQAELERHQNRRQVYQKQRARLELGYWAFASRKPYKMTKDPIHGNLLTLQYPEAKWLKEAMEGFATGIFSRKIDACRFLVEKGYWKVQKPEKYIDKLTELFSDVLFAGYIEYRKWEVERRKGHHQALISIETFDLIQKRMRRESLNKRIRVDVSEDLPLRGLVVCDNCGHTMTGAPSSGRSKKYLYYFCQNKNCKFKQKSIPKMTLENKFDVLLKTQKMKKEVGLIIEKVFESVWNQEILEIKQQEKDTVIKKCALEEKIKELTNLAIKTKSNTVRILYEKQIEEIANEIDEVEISSTEKIDLSIPYRTALNKATNLLKSPYKIWDKLPVIEKQQLFYFIFEEKIPYDMQRGYRTDKIPTAIRLFEDFVIQNSPDVEMGEIESPCRRFLPKSLHIYTA